MKSLFLLLLVVCSACSGIYKNNVNLNLDEPIRVAVLPFLSIGEKGEISKDEARLLIDTFTLVSDEQTQTPSQIVRRQVLSELKNTSLDIVSPVLIDVELPHHGFINSDGSIDLEKLYKASPKDICTHLIDCDAVMYGTVKKWDRSYYGLESVSSVDLDIKIVSGRDNKELFTASAQDSEGRGISKIPTGISSIVVEPINGLNSNIIVELSNKMVHKMFLPLNLKNRPEYLESGPPVIFASAHDAPSGIIKDSLIVVAYASENQIASFSIGSAIPSVPMFEISPGNYYGEFIPLNSENFTDQSIRVNVKDIYGRNTSQNVSGKSISLIRK